MRDRELESYLTTLEKFLGPIPVSERAEIITEIKSHVLDAIENDQNRTVATVLSDLGEPEQVANKYLSERGLGLQKPYKYPIVKWLVIGVLGMGVLSVLLISIVVWKFTPFISVDEEEGRVQIMGGLIDINDKSGKIKINGGSKFGNNYDSFTGTQSLNDLDGTTLTFNFSNTKVEFIPNGQNQVEYDCKIKGKAEISTEKGVFFNFKETSGSKCTFKIPPHLLLKINANNGKFHFNKIRNHLNLNMLNGKVEFNPDKESKYYYDLSLMNGKIDNFESSNDDDAYKIRISIMNGKINN